MTATTLAGLVSDGLLAERIPLAPFTTYKLGGPARYLMEASSEADVLALTAVFAADPARRLPLLVVGRGSNLVVSDAGFDGVVIHLGGGFGALSIGTDGVARAGGAVPLPRLARETVRAGRGGLEFFVGIPGSVGGAVRMNAGCHGTDTAARLQRARVVDLEGGTSRWWSAAELGLTYRHSLLEDHHVVVAAEFSTDASPPEELEERLREITKWRRATQPGGTLNAGSVFKNPPGDSAGRLIDSVGLKGFRVGRVTVSERHANFFVAEPGAPAQDIYDLVGEVRRRVAAATGVELVPEIRFAGEFAPAGGEGLQCG